MYGLSPPKLTPEGIEHETFGGENSKILSQQLANPKWVKDIELWILLFTQTVLLIPKVKVQNAPTQLNMRSVS